MTDFELCVVVLCCLTLGCENTSKDAPTEPTPSATAGTVPKPVETPPRGGTSAAGARRDLHPIEGNTDCMEMYSACTLLNGENQCTSASLLLACGETARLPSTGEQLTCVCP
jgi:hypothetical protein